MKKFMLILLTFMLMFSFPVSAYADITDRAWLSWELSGKPFDSFDELKNAVNSKISSVSPSASYLEFPARPDVTYMVEKAEFIDMYTIEATITFAGDRKSSEDFGTYLFLAVYSDNGMRLVNLSIKGLYLNQPFLSSGRRTITQTVTVPNGQAAGYIVKAITMTSTESMRPTCTAPKWLNECEVSVGGALPPPTITADVKIKEIPLERTEKRIKLDYKAIDSASIDKGWYFSGMSGDASNHTKLLPNIIELGANVSVIGLQGLLLTIKIDVSDSLSPVIISAEKKAGKNAYIDVKPSLLYSKNNGMGYIEYYESIHDDKIQRQMLNRNEQGNIDVNVYSNLVLDVPYDFGNSAVRVGGNASDLVYRFYDTTGSGAYDTIHVINEKAFVIGAINQAMYIIFRDVSSQNVDTTYNKASLILDPTDDNINWSMKNSQGATLSLSVLQVGQVANVRISSSGAVDFYEIIITDDIIAGTVMVVSAYTNKVTGQSETTYIIGGNEYKLFYSLPFLKLGDDIVAKVANNGEIIAYNIATETRNYALIIATNVAEEFGKTYQIQMMTTDGNIVVLNLNRRYNGAYTNVDYTSQQLASLFPKGGLAVYEKNSSNEIKSIRVNSAVDIIDSNLKGVTIDDTYVQLSERIGTKFFTDNTAVFMTEAMTSAEITRDNVIIGSSSYLEDGQNYKGYAIIDNNSRNIKTILLFETGAAINWNSYPMAIKNVASVSVDGETRVKYTGYVYGEETSITVAANKYFNFRVNDIILYVTNGAGEMVNAFRLGGFNGFNYDVMVSDTANEDNKLAVECKIAQLSTAICPDASLAVQVSASTIDDPSSATIPKAKLLMKGFSIAGKAYDVRGKILRLINDYSSTFVSGAVRNYGVDEAYIDDYSFNSSANVYVYNARTKKIRVSSIGELTTDKSSLDNVFSGASTAANATKKSDGRDNDDSVYLYKYDGKTYLVLVIDGAGDNN